MFNFDKNEEKINSPQKTFNIFNIFSEDNDKSKVNYRSPPQNNNPFSSPLSKKILQVIMISKVKVFVIMIIIIIYIVLM